MYNQVKDEQIYPEILNYVISPQSIRKKVQKMTLETIEGFLEPLFSDISWINLSIMICMKLLMKT